MKGGCSQDRTKNKLRRDRRLACQVLGWTSGKRPDLEQNIGSRVKETPFGLRPTPQARAPVAYVVATESYSAILSGSPDSSTSLWPLVRTREKNFLLRVRQPRDAPGWRAMLLPTRGVLEPDGRPDRLLQHLP